MKLLNFSVGQVWTIQVGAETMQTAHVKAPIAEPWIVTPDGAAGDQRAVHPDKIYAFARTGYVHWGERLQVDPATWGDGFFGENLTLDTLDEQDVRIGDVFAVGDEVRLVVTGARTPCVKLAWRLNQPRTFQKTFAKSRNTGAYLGVLAAGTVRPGDTMQRIHHDPAMPSIADVCDFVADHKPPPLEPLQRLLAFEGLSLTIRLLLGAKLDAARRAADALEGRWAGWRDFTLTRIVDEAPEIRSFHLRPTDGGTLCQPRPGQFVTVRMRDDTGQAITRTWSLSSFAHGMDSYRLTVRRQSGPGSNWMHRTVEGAVLSLRAPAGDFALDMGGFRPVVLIAAGIGITPLLAMLHAHLTRPRPGQIHVIYGARTPAATAFRAELDALAAAHPCIRVTYVYSGSDAGGRPAGRITPDLLIDTLSDLHVVLDNGHRVDLPWYEGDTYLCGPGDFCTGLREQLVARGANGDHVFSELFAAPPAEPSEIDLAEVRFVRSGIAATWRAQDDLTLLELAEQAGIDVPHDCRAGACMTCRTSILEGDATATMGDGTVLLCIGRPRTAALQLDL